MKNLARMKKNKIIILVLLFCTISFCSCRSDYAKIKCNYMAYACGDCYPQFRIDSIYSSTNNLLKIDDNIHLKLKKENTFVDLESLIDRCWICYDYYVEGTVNKNIFTGTKTMIVTKYNFILRENCCTASIRTAF